MTSVVWCAHDEAGSATPPDVRQGRQPVTACPAGGPDSGNVMLSAHAVRAARSSALHSDACEALPQCDAGDVEVTAIHTCSKPGVLLRGDRVQLHDPLLHALSLDRRR